MEEYVEQNKSSIMFLKYYQDENGKPLNIKKYPTIMYKLLEQNPGVEGITNVVRYCPKKLGAKLKEQINKLSNPLFVNYFNAIIKMFRDRVGSEPHEYFGAFKSALNKYH